MYYIIREINGLRFYASTDIDWNYFGNTAISFTELEECEKFKNEYIWEDDAKIIWHT